MLGSFEAVARARADAAQPILDRLASGQLRRLRVAWPDLHATTRCKTLLPSAVAGALRDGIEFVGTLLLKDTSDRTAVPVFDRDASAALPQFANAANLLLLPDPRTFVELPWSPGTGWLLADAWEADGSACPVDPRHVLARQIARLADHGYRLRCGLEVEFHVYRVASDTAHADPALAAWPGAAPQVELLHAGYRLLSEESVDASHHVLELIESTALGLGLPLRSLEIEFGPSQFEAVFDVQDAAAAADAMVLFRSAIRQVLARHGYLASFMCRPPFPSVMSSGWHLHQSLVDAEGRNAFDPASNGRPPGAATSGTGLSTVGETWLAGLIAHVPASCLLGTSTANGYGRFRPGALAPTRIGWGRDDRSALFRLVGTGRATRIENRLGEPAANPFLYLASQIVGGLDALERSTTLDTSGAPPDGASFAALPADSPGNGAELPADLGQALAAFARAGPVRTQFGAPLCRVLEAAKTSEWVRYRSAEDRDDFERREYLARF